MGGTCLMPLEFLYDIPQDQVRNSLLERTFMVGRAVKVSPVMQPTNGKKVYSSYFPKGKWVNLADWSEVIDGKDAEAELQVRPTANAHLAPGALIPF